LAQLRTDAPPILYKLREVDHFRRDLGTLLVSRWHAGRIIAAVRKLPDRPRILRAVNHPKEYEIACEDVG
jgi:hypothetical protein